MSEIINFFTRRTKRVPSVAATRPRYFDAKPPSVQAVVVGHGIHYLATQRGFLKGFATYDGNRVPEFTGNARFAKQFDSFQEADDEGKRLMLLRGGIKYYSIFKPA